MISAKSRCPQPELATHPNAAEAGYPAYYCVCEDVADDTHDKVRRENRPADTGI